MPLCKAAFDCLLKMCLSCSIYIYVCLHDLYKCIYFYYMALKMHLDVVWVIYDLKPQYDHNTLEDNMVWIVIW